MSWPNHVEVATVESGDARGAQALRNGNQTRVDPAEGQIGVELDELGDSDPVLRTQDLDLKVTSCERPVERCLSGRSELAIDQPAGLAHDQVGRHQRAGILLDEAGTPLVIGISAVGSCEKDPGVDDQHGGWSVSPEALGEKIFGL